MSANFQQERKVEVGKYVQKSLIRQGGSTISAEYGNNGTTSLELYRNSFWGSSPLESIENMNIKNIDISIIKSTGGSEVSKNPKSLEAEFLSKV